MNNSKFLKLVSEETLKLDAVDGSRTFATEKNVSWLDSNYQKWNAIEAGIPTPETEILIYELVGSANIAMIFGSFNQDPEALCFTQDQILNFTEKHKNWLQKNLFATFLLFKANGKFYVCDVPFLSGKDLWISIDQFGAIYRWKPEDRRNIVIPKLGIQH